MSKTTEKDLLQFCRYYKGEETPPAGTNETLWNIERVWIRDTLDDESDAMERLLFDWLKCGLRGFHRDDGVPLTLKATFLNRYLQHNEMFDKKSFVAAYEKAYGK